MDTDSEEAPSWVCLHMSECGCTVVVFQPVVNESSNVGSGCRINVGAANTASGLASIIRPLLGFLSLRCLQQDQDVVVLATVLSKSTLTFFRVNDLAGVFADKGASGNALFCLQSPAYVCPVSMDTRGKPIMLRVAFALVACVCAVL